MFLYYLFIREGCICLRLWSLLLEVVNEGRELGFVC